jgi:broad specificity phosphatase PhoE
MSKLIYITHPEVTVDPEVPIDQWELSEEGFDSVERLLEWDLFDEVDYVYTSEEKKAYTVAEQIKRKCGIDYAKIKDLGEMDRSSTGVISPKEKYMEAVKSAYENPASGINGWESHLAVMLRNAKVIEELAKNHKDKTIMIVGHGGAGTTIKCFIKKILPNFSEDPQETGCYFIANLDKWEVIQDWVKY